MMKSAVSSIKKFLNFATVGFCVMLNVSSTNSFIINHNASTREIAAFTNKSPVSPKTNIFRSTTSSSTSSTLSMGFFDDVQKIFKSLTVRASASHILIKGGAEAENKLQDLKEEIEDSPVKFAEMAAMYSSCPSGKSGGNLGEFGPGQMVKEFDNVVFNEAVGVVHGPIQTQFGYHLILINERSD
uniref:Peptidyl-prolyl cis-trans isomerase n=1 Tax=Corethron hystrix TaxID=216773 RepID=A0A7S1BYF0_9STRA|mmetsp:Transcript_6840/g.14764  ORF Transcript_6840/g.14764 Transcript_6840/m.14764 type:complete len:185 (+) Transcript_6840:107-661(+)